MARKGAEREATELKLEDVPRPMSEEQFRKIELALRSMRDRDDEFVVVGFADVIEGMDFIQAASMESYKQCVIEIGYTKDWKHRKMYRRTPVPINETVEIFRSVCMTRKNPDTLGWKDITKEIWPKMKG